MTTIRLPDSITACLFDLDGVLTTTAKIHFAAWKQMFDAYLQERDGAGYAPFTQHDYDAYVDGRPRYDGVRGFLESRGIQLAEPQVRELGDRKNVLVNQIIESQGVEPYPGSVRFLDAVREAGLRTAVVSSSANCKAVVEAAGIADRLEVRVDGVTIEREHLKGKPAPDSFLRAAEELGVDKSAAAVFEDALAGVEAGRAGGFGCVVGVNRVGQAEALKEHGADVVVDDLGELLG
ncbi:MAG TPA: beta-phosphoglucomutase family hydrolase [Capillimicrobium sp.]|nr:beta-phosphoglucomutase family hydrolase [Capillimicrobium sp.]